jgi:predicted ATPase/class 3 adenylate cyclase
MSTEVFVVTDIEGSTRRWATLPVAMRAALARHDDIVRGVIEGAGGRVFKHTGDGLLAVFVSVLPATQAALSAQVALQREDFAAVEGLGVRFVVHVGEAEPSGGDFFGPALNRAARVCGLIHGGQVVLTDAIRALLVDVGGLKFDLVDLGTYPLRGLTDPERLWQVLSPDLPSEFPPIRAIDDQARGEMPSQMTSFIGRTRECTEIAGLVAAHRMVTIAGPGGIGKTRLAIAASETITGDFTAGAWLVELASVVSPEAVAEAVMAALGERPVPGLSARETLLKVLISRQLLIVFDNCEHVLEAAAQLASELLDHCPFVRVLATSRQSLGVDGEHVFRLGSLTQDDRVKLFAQRARAVRSDFESDQAAIATLCERLDGMPLAIELAAGRLRSMSVEEISRRLDERFRVLEIGRADRGRHRTLGAVVEWSYDLLDDTNRTFLTDLSVFAGDFDLAAATAITGFDDDLDALDQLDRLVDRSLVVVRERDQRTTYRLLDTVRAFAMTRLDNGRRRVDQARHAAHYIASIARANALLRRGDIDDGMNALGRDWDNIREAVRGALESEDTGRAMGLVSQLLAPVIIRPNPEPVAWAEKTLALPGAEEHPQAMWVHLLFAQIAYTHLDCATAETHARAALVFAQRLQREVPRIHLALGYATTFGGRFHEALVAFLRAAELARTQARPMELLEAINGVNAARIYGGGRPDPAEVEEAQALDAAYPDSRGHAMTRLIMASAAYFDGDPCAAELFAEAAETGAAGNLVTSEACFRMLAAIVAAGDDPRRYVASAREALSTYDRTHLPFALWGQLRDVIPGLNALGRHHAVATTDGATSPATFWPKEVALAITSSRAAIGERDYDATLSTGTRLTSDEFADYLRAELDDLGV